MTTFQPNKRLEDTILWKELSRRTLCQNSGFPSGILDLCAEASTRMKLMATFAPQYTLHDETHLLRVVDLMGSILGEEVTTLNDIELALLILAAYFHDQGMIPTNEQYKEMLASDDFTLHRENWHIEHPNYREIQRQKLGIAPDHLRTERFNSLLAEMDQAHLTEYLRLRHGKGSADYVRTELGNDKRMLFGGISLAPYLASLCESHTLQSDDIQSLQYCSWDEQIATATVNMIFLALVLRIADILDFDRERTPDVLFRSIHFSSDVSLREWERHRSVVGWSFSSNVFRITVECSHPAYHQATVRYMDWIEQEIRDSKRLLSYQPHSTNQKQIRLPDTIDRSRIRPKNNSYRLHDLEFGLQRDEMVRLLMTDKLYGNPHLCVRELLQNALDALRYRKALFAESGVDWTSGWVELRHYLDSSGDEVLECSDNGTGMDEDIVRNFLTKVGRSYYRSPFFERERNRLRKSGHDFDPCSQFGIGFMSCFMIGDRITIRTRKDYGYGKEWGPPLVIEIQGLSGAVIVRDGDRFQQPGTIVNIVSRRCESILDELDDRIKLCDVVSGYALATEFEIRSRCEVPSIAESVTIPPRHAIFPTTLEMAGVSDGFLIEQPLSEVHSELLGYIRETFLTNDSGMLTLESSDGRWIRSDPHKNRMHWEFLADGLDPSSSISHRLAIGDAPVCVDGILLTGPPGRAFGFREKMRLGWSNSHMYTNFSALVDARGSTKPEFTPARTAPKMGFADFPPRWKRLDLLFRKGKGLLLEKLLMRFSDHTDPELLWKVLLIHGECPTTIPTRSILKLLKFPVVAVDGSVLWMKLPELGQMRLKISGEGDFEILATAGRIGVTSELKSWEEVGDQSGESRPILPGWISDTLVMNCALDVDGDNLVLSACVDDGTPECPEDRTVRRSLGRPSWIIPFRGAIASAISATACMGNANANHPLVGSYLSSQFSNQPTDIEKFAGSFVRLISDLVFEAKDADFLLEITRWHKRAAMLFFAVPWDHYDDALKPPYYVWTPFGMKEIGENDFAIWRDADVPRLEY